MSSLRNSLIVILEPFGEFVDVLGRPAGYFHAEMEAHLGQHFLDLVERLAAEIRGSQHFALGLLNEVANVDYIVVLETVCRTHRELKLVNFLEEGRVEGKIRNGLGDADFLAGFLEIDEHVELVLENARGKSQCIFRGNRSIGLDLHGQLVVVENLSLTGVLHPIGHLLDRRIQAVDRDQPDRCILRPIALRRHIALAGIDGKFHADLGALVEVTQHQLRIENHDVADGLDVARVTSAGPVFFTTMRFGPSPCILMAMSLMLRMMSVTSSRTPAMEENSWRTPSMCTDCTLAPCREDSRIRRSALPSVNPKPRSSGSATTVAEHLGSGPSVT